MEAIREQLRKPLVTGIAGLVLGIILGVFYGWVINPVQWTDAAATHLRADLKQDWLRMAIESYSRDGNAAQALQRWQDLEPGAAEVLAQLEANPGALSMEAIAGFRTAITPPAPEVEAPAGGGNLGSLLAVTCLMVLVLGGAIALVFYLRQRGGGVRTFTSAEQSQEASQTAERTDYAALGEEPPVGQFMTTYMLGDDLFDDSFSVDSPAGEFLGECGVGISDVIGVGDPKRVSAFEVWLFDKNDIQTVTKVLMSRHAYEEDDTRQRLAAKGEPLQAEPGSQVVLETATLRLVARVVDMAYGDSALPADSHFERITIELAVWPINARAA
jgi:hypothetical protein